MKQKKKKLPCDIVAEDNTSWLNMLGKVAACKSRLNPENLWESRLVSAGKSQGVCAKVARCARKSFNVYE